jgi:hypothetical protein
VLAAVELNYQAPLDTAEVGDETADRIPAGET